MSKRIIEFLKGRSYHSFNKLYFLDLLNKSNSTCFRLFSDINNKYSNSQYFFIENKFEMLNVLELIRLECWLEGKKPIIHIEGHGDINLGLIVSKTEETINFAQLITTFRKINIASSNNLGLVLPFCFGAKTIMSDYNRKDCSPYYFSIVTERAIIKEKELDIFYRFYSSLIDTSNCLKAWDNQVKDIKLLVCEKSFLESIIQSFTNFKNHKNIEKTVNHLITKKRLLGLDMSDISNDRREMKNKLRGKNDFQELRHIFDEMKKSYLLADYPCNKNRFTYSFDEIYDEFIGFS